MIVTVNCPICKVMRIYTPPFGGCSETAPFVPNSVPLRIVSCKGSFVKKCRVLGVWEDATSGSSPFIYKGRKSVGCGEGPLLLYKGFAISTLKAAAMRRLRSKMRRGRSAGRGTFPAMGKYPKDRRGTPQRRTSFANDGFPPVPHYGGHPFTAAITFRRVKI